MASSLDVARKAGVSQSAVSRVFTPGASASKKMRERVMSVAEELGYRPNILARSLITGRSRIIGLIVAYIDNLYYPLAVERLSRALQERGYHILMFMAAQTDSGIDDVLSEILDYQVDGIVMASVSMSSDLVQRCDAAGVPVVMFNRSLDDERFSSVTSDNAGGAAEVARFLMAGEHQRIAYLAGWPGASTQRDREAGFTAALAEAGRTVFARDSGDYTFEGAQAATRRLFARPERPDALFVANDHMAIAAMDVLRFELGLGVPDDVSVASYDDVPQAAWASYRLTSVRQPTEQMIAAVVEALTARIEGGDTHPHRACFAGDLVVRSSARIPPGWPA